MAVSERDQSSLPRCVSAWDYDFELTEKHLSSEEIKAGRAKYDVLGEKCYHRIVELQEKPTAADPLPPPPGKRKDLIDTLKSNAKSDPLLAELWDHVTAVPSWVDWNQIARGQDVYYRYAGATLVGLTYQSLIGGFGSAKVVEVLSRTGGFSPVNARRRMFETTQYVLQCTSDIDSMKPGGQGWEATIRVRLLHAAVRSRIMKLRESDPNYYNVEEWGVPINDIDAAGTIASFSSNLIWIAFPRIGITARQVDIEDYIALWRYISYLIGADTDPFATPTDAKILTESLLYHEVDPSSESKVLANVLIDNLANTPPMFASRRMLLAAARWINGDELSDELGLERPPYIYTMAVALQFRLYICIFYIQMMSPAFDRFAVRKFRQFLWDFTVESSHGLKGRKSLFLFKYVPQLGKMTKQLEKEEQPPKSNRRLFVGALQASILACILYSVSLFVTN